MSDIANQWALLSGMIATDPLVLELSEFSFVGQLHKGARLIEEVDSTDSVYLLKGGRLSAVKYTKNGHEIWLSDFHAGDLMGELAALTSTTRSSAVIARTQSSVIGISKAHFLSAMHKSPEFSTAIAKILAHRIAETSRQLGALIGLSLINRLHAELIQIATQTSDDEVYEITSIPPISQIASRIHATREATSRALSQLEKHGLVVRIKSKLRVIYSHQVEV